MKLTKEQADYIRSKKSFKSEGIVKSIFGRLLKKKLKNDRGFMKAVDDADKATEKLKKTVLQMKKDGVEIAITFNRYVLSPDEDITNQPTEVQSICNLVWTQEIKDAWAATLA